MDDKQRFYERLNGMVIILDKILTEGANFDFYGNIAAINSL